MWMTIDVFYKDGPIAPPNLDLVRGWDGVVYGETNVQELAGAGRLVFPGDNHSRPAWICDDQGRTHVMCGPCGAIR